MRGLGEHSSSKLQSLPHEPKEEENGYTHQIEVSSPRKPLKVSSRNVLKGVVTRVVNGSVSSEVTLKIVHEVELTSIITRVSADELELIEGAQAYAVIKSNDIVIARD